jgi:hypothetical protein
MRRENMTPALQPTHNVETPLFDYAEKMRFNGATYKPALDDMRLTGQIQRVFNLMRDGQWRTLMEIADATSDPQSSISAQLRHLRKVRFGSHTVNKRSRGQREHGLFEYQLIVKEK